MIKNFVNLIRLRFRKGEVETENLIKIIIWIVFFALMLFVVYFLIKKFSD